MTPSSPGRPAGVRSPSFPASSTHRFPRLRALCLRCEKYVPLFSFSAGFAWDALTLTRIDRMADNLILLAYLIALAAMIVATLRRRFAPLPPSGLARFQPYFPWAMQFLIGGLLSSYVVFYFRSVSWTQTQVFFVILVALFVGNEFLEERLANERLLAAMFTFCTFSFLAFFLPVALARITPGIYMVAGAISLTVSLAVFALALRSKAGDWRRQTRSVAVVILTVWALHNAFYFTNLIPPVPLALRDAGIFHKVARAREGYEVQCVAPPWYRFWRRCDDPLYLSPGETVYCYSAVFAPRGIRVPVRHVWSRLEPGKGWVETSRITFEITGGREGGYRGYSMKSAVTAGRWRVEVETDRGQILGEIDFKVTASSDRHPPLVTRLLR